MKITNSRDVWEWRELTWPDTLTHNTVRDTLEQLAASGTIGPVILETRATKAGLRWLIAARPTHIENAITMLAAHLSVRAHTPRRIREPVEHAADLRVTGTDLSLDPARITASVRGTYGALSRLHDGEEVVLQLLLGRRHTPPVRPRESLHAWLKLLAIPTSKTSSASTRKHRDEQHGFSMSLRIGASGVTSIRARQLVGDIVGALRVLESSASRIRAVTGRPSHFHQPELPWRWPLVLTSGEILSFTGWPIGEPPLPLLGSIHPRQLLPPVTLIPTDRVIGTTSAPGHAEKVGISIRDAAFHTHLLMRLGL